jgi:hypothetical protein
LQPVAASCSKLQQLAASCNLVGQGGEVVLEGDGVVVGGVAGTEE